MIQFVHFHFFFLWAKCRQDLQEEEETLKFFNLSIYHFHDVPRVFLASLSAREIAVADVVKLAH
jgi:hypothetical protein